MGARRHHRTHTRAAGVALAAMAAVTVAAGCSASSPTVETSKAPGNVPTSDAPTGTGTAVPGTVGTTPGTTGPDADAGTTVPGETTTSLAGGPAATTADGAPITSATLRGNPGGGVTTTPGAAPTTAKPGTPTTAPVTTVPVTNAPTTAPPTTAAKPTLTADDTAPPTSQDYRQIMCMGPPSAMVTITFSATNATRVAVAMDKLSDAFTNPVPNMNLNRTSGSQNVTLSCTVTGTQWTTVTAEGPGGKTTVVIPWTIMHM